MRLTMKPGMSRAAIVVLPNRFGERDASSRRSRRSVGRPRTISTSFISGTGFMKCMPITCSGRRVARGELGDRDRRRVGREDRAGRAAPASSSLKISSLSVLVLGRRLDRRSRTARDRAVARAGRDARQRSRRAPRPSSLPFSTSLPSCCADLAACPSRRARRRRRRARPRARPAPRPARCRAPIWPGADDPDAARSRRRAQAPLARASAMPSPPPMHSDAHAASSRRAAASACSSVTSTRAPEAPMGGRARPRRRSRSPCAGSRPSMLVVRHRRPPRTPR